MLGQHRRSWTNIKPALVKRVVFAGKLIMSEYRFTPPETGIMGQCVVFAWIAFA